MTGAAVAGCAGNWPSPLSAAAVAAGGIRLAQPSVCGASTYWLEGRPAERGRVALMRASPPRGRRSGDRDGSIEELTPRAASVRSRVYEYGGGAYLACAAAVFYIDDAFRDADGAALPGQVHRILAPGRAVPLTRAPGRRFADLALDAPRQRLVAVCEDLRQDAHRPTHTLVAIALSDGSVTTLAAGRDFYASPRVSPDGERLLFLAWDLPGMPWDAAALHAFVLTAAGHPQGCDPATGMPAGAATPLAGPAAFQPCFATDGALWWSDDADGHFVLARSKDGVTRYADGARECALPSWNLNMRCFAPLPDGGAVAASVAGGLWRLRALSAAGHWRDLSATSSADLTQVDHLDGAEGRVVVLGGGPRLPLGVHEFDRIGDTAVATHRVLARSSTLDLAAAWLPTPEPLAFTGGDGGECHALYWAPASATHALKAGERPPLLLRCHGGPTAAASSALDARTLYWTTRGWAVLDLNYRGSWGYGSAYRRALDGRWGDADAADAVAAARHAIATGRADPLRVALTGSSAGGLTVLNALTLPAAPFASAAVHYGLADLVAALRDTHKFEAGYGETLLGPWPAARDAWQARSPLARTARLRTPCIFFQGLDDKVVPPDQTERIAGALTAAGVRVEVQRYAGEGHGFRRSDTIADALTRELAFHARSFDAAGSA